MRPNTAPITESHFELLTANGTQTALIRVIDPDAKKTVNVLSFHTYHDTFVVESVIHRFNEDWAVGSRLLLVNAPEAIEAVSRVLEDVVTQQRRGTDTLAEYHLVTGTREIHESDQISDLLSETQSQTEMEPPFRIPEGESVTQIDVGSDSAEVLQNADERFVGTGASYHQHQNSLYIVGLDESDSRKISDACHRLQMEFQEAGLYEDAEAASRAESAISGATPETGFEFAGVN